jgi:hypothetical protein
MKIPQLGAELIHADGQTDMTNLIIAFHKFAKAPNNELHASTKVHIGVAHIQNMK